jgi:hypothetical protein
MRPAAGQVRDELVSERVEVENAARVVVVRNPGGLQIDSDHHGRPLPGPTTRPETFAVAPTARPQVLLQDSGQIGTDWKHVTPSMLRIRCLHCDGGRRRIEIETRRHQAGQFTGAQARGHSHLVQNRAVGT